MDAAQFRYLYCEDGLEEVEDEIDDSWRHGNYHDTVFSYDPEDGSEVTYWRAQYRVSGDGEYNDLRDDEGWHFHGQVWPVEKVIKKIVYVSTKPVDNSL